MYNVSNKLMKVVSDNDREIYEIINSVVITGPVCVFGVVANVMNIMVFYKQGFKNTMNISFFGLAIADICGLLTLLWFSVSVNPLFVYLDINLILPEVQYLTAGIPHICFARITGWITVFITAERCLCITIPLKIKQVITPRRTKVTLCFMFAGIMISFYPEYQTAYIYWKFYPSRNRTLLGLVFTRDRHNMKGLVFIMYSVLGSVSFIAVILFTILLMVQLKKKSKWRRQITADAAQSESVSNRERKAMTMVVMIAAVLIVCYTPGVIASLATFFEPELSIVGHYVNAFFALWSFVFIFEALNSSVNIFLYYNMSTKYRETFLQTFVFWNKEPVVTT